MDKDTKLAQVYRTLENQEAKIGQLQQHINELQQKENDTKNMHKLEITPVKITLSNNTEEIYWLRNQNKKSIGKTMKLKITKKADKSNEDVEGKVLEKQEENQRLLNLNKELKEQLKKHKYEEKMQEDSK